MRRRYSRRARPAPALAPRPRLPPWPARPVPTPCPRPGLRWRPAGFRRRPSLKDKRVRLEPERRRPACSRTSPSPNSRLCRLWRASATPRARSRPSNRGSIGRAKRGKPNERRADCRLFSWEEHPSFETEAETPLRRRRDETETETPLRRRRDQRQRDAATNDQVCTQSALASPVVEATPAGPAIVRGRTDQHHEPAASPQPRPGARWHWRAERARPAAATGHAAPPGSVR